MTVSTKAKRWVAAAYALAILSVLLPSRLYIPYSFGDLRHAATSVVGLSAWLVVVASFTCYALAPRPEETWAGDLLKFSNRFFGREEEISRKDITIVSVALGAIYCTAVFLAYRLIDMPR